MKRFTPLIGQCLAFFLLLSNLPAHLNAQNIAKRITASNGDTIPFLEYKPAGHDAPGNTRKYPLIVFLHGGGEQSNNTSIAAGAPVWDIEGFGPSRLVSLGYKMAFTWNGQVDTFIVLSPMCRSTFRSTGNPIGQWQVAYITSILNYAKNNLKIDTNRVYLTGMSFGGGGTFGFLAFNAANAKRLAAAAPLCAPPHHFDGWGSTPNGAQYVGDAKLPVWGFHAENDSTCNVTGTTIPIDSINNHIPSPEVKALKTIWPDGGHGIWPRVYNIDNPAYTYGYDGILNIYEWFLGQNKSLPVNVLPTANVGSDTTICTSSGAATLNGALSTDPDGSIVRYVWKKISGPAVGTIATPLGSSSSTTVSGLTTAGVYKYQLNVVDNRAAIARDTLTITVTSSCSNSGKALTMSSLGRITAGNVTQLNNASKFTLEAQFKYDATVSGWTTIMRKSTSLSDRIMIHIGPNNNSIYVMVGNGSNTYGYTGANAVSPGTWYHVAAVFDGTQSGNANRLKVYIDGVQQTLSFSAIDLPANTSTTNTAPFMAGGEPGCCYLNGTIDEVRVWDTVLSAATIGAWKDKLLGSCHPNIAHLVVYWPLDDNTNPSTATAELGTAYSGTITNGTYVTSAQATTSSGCSGARVVFAPPLEAIKENKPLNGKIYPNPTEGLIRLELNASVSKSVTVNVLDLFGRNLYSNKTSVVKGFNRISLNITSLPSGVYMIEVRDGQAIVEKYKLMKR